MLLGAITEAFPRRHWIGHPFSKTMLALPTKEMAGVASAEVSTFDGHP